MTISLQFLHNLSCLKTTSILICQIFCLSLNWGTLEAARTFGNLRVEKVCRVHDGDTFIADIGDIHPLIGSQISIRIGGIDSPEITDKRVEIKKLAVQARDYVAERLNHAGVIVLVNIQRDKYFRILADVHVDDCNLATELINLGLAKPYDGGKKPQWD